MEYITDKKAQEKSTFVISVSPTDEDGQAVTPSSFKWSLIDGAGNYINQRQDQEKTPATTINIVLSDNDLQIQTSEVSENEVLRYLICEWVYDSTYGSGLTGKEQICFVLENLKKVT